MHAYDHHHQPHSITIVYSSLLNCSVSSCLTYFVFQFIPVFHVYHSILFEAFLLDCLISLEYYWRILVLRLLYSFLATWRDNFNPKCFILFLKSKIFDWFLIQIFSNPSFFCLFWFYLPCIFLILCYVVCNLHDKLH